MYGCEPLPVLLIITCASKFNWLVFLLITLLFDGGGDNVCMGIDGFGGCDGGDKLNAIEKHWHR